ncbi:hypothetical protein ACSQ67_024367 [Phaseolus vulgaris]
MSDGGKRQGGRALPPPPRGPPPPPPSRPRLEPVDREKTCPLLLRVFTKIGGHHSMEDFAVRGKEPKDEVQIYTWKDATLRELTDLVKEVAPAARRRNAKLSFAFVFPDKNGRFKVQEKNTCIDVSASNGGANDSVSGDSSGIVSDSGSGKRDCKTKNERLRLLWVGKTLSYGNGRLDDGKALAELGFEIGDYLDVAIV